MRKSLIIAAVVLVLAGLTTLPAFAGDPPGTEKTEQTVDVGVTVSSGTSSPPVVKAKWEAIWVDTNGDGVKDLDELIYDEDPVAPGMQVLPPLVQDGTRQICYFAVIWDPNGIGNIDPDRVYVDVYHPLNKWGDGSLKYQVKLNKVVLDPVNLPMYILHANANGGIITYDPAYNLDEVVAELEQASALLFLAQKDISYHQPAGWYHVDAYAIDKEGSQSAMLPNDFEYVEGLSFDLDFTALDFGTVEICSEKWIEGDKDMALPGPSIKNLSNVWLNVGVHFDSMGFGYTNVDGVDRPNVVFDARLDLFDPVPPWDTPITNWQAFIEPCEEVWLPGHVALCNTEKLSFSIHVIKGTPGGVYRGQATIMVRADP